MRYRIPAGPRRLRLHDLPPEEWPAQRLAGQAPETLGTAELLDGLLRLPELVGAELLARAGGLHALARLSEAELGRIPGLGPVAAGRLRAAFALAPRLNAPEPPYPTVGSPADAAALLTPAMRGLEQEELWVMLLSCKNRVMAVHAVYRGNITSTVVRAAEVYREAVRRNSSAILVAHNHPSLDPSPSPDDVATTRRLVEAGQVLGIELLDHLIVGGHQYVSLRQTGMGF
jgi:DNA repair protein RadC